MTSNFSTTLVLSAEESLNFLSSLIHPNQDALNKRDVFLESLNTMDININMDGSMDIFVPDLFLPMSFSLSSTIATDTSVTSVVLETPQNPVEINYTYDTSSSKTDFNDTTTEKTDSGLTYSNKNNSAQPDTDFIRNAA